MALRHVLMPRQARSTGKTELAARIPLLQSSPVERSTWQTKPELASFWRLAGNSRRSLETRSASELSRHTRPRTAGCSFGRKRIYTEFRIRKRSFRGEL